MDNWFLVRLKQSDDEGNEFCPYNRKEAERVIDCQVNNIDRELAAYLKKSVPDIQCFKTIVSDIGDYYNKFFAYNGFSFEKEINNSAEKTKEIYSKIYIKDNKDTNEKILDDFGKVDIQVYLSEELSEEDDAGDLTSGVYYTIRLNCYKYTPNMQFMPILKAIFDQFNVDDVKWFEFELRFVLAHELYHLFHEYDYKCRGNASIPKTAVNDILKECFADYFAYSYIRYYLNNDDNYVKKTMVCYLSELDRSKKTCEANIREFVLGESNIYKDYFIDLCHRGRTELHNFGIGRKRLLSEKYENEEIESDQEYAEAMDRKNVNDSNKYLLTWCDAVTPADYAGGYKLYVYSNKINRYGLDLPEYKTAYANMIDGNSEQALYDLIELRL